MTDPNGDAANEPESSGEATEGEPRVAASPLEEMTAERDRYKDQLLRTAADFENYRKRARRDVEDADRRGREETIRELLPVFDNLERAVAAAETAQDARAVADGVQMVLRLFEDVGTRLGLARVVSIGSSFDPNLHDAVQQVESDEPSGTVVAEVAPGWRLKDKLVRPAMVVVARPRKPADA